MTIIISGDTGVPVSPVTGTLAVLNGGTGVTTSTGSGANVLGTSPSLSGAVMTTMASSVITSGTAVASTSGTSITFTGIPSWAKRITISLSGVSTNGANDLLIQIGSGSLTTTGYSAQRAYMISNTSYSAGATSTSCICLISTNTSADVKAGQIVLTNVSGNTWVGTAAVATINTLLFGWSAGTITLAGVLDRVAVVVNGGVDTFDAGTINILYE